MRLTLLVIAVGVAMLWLSLATGLPLLAAIGVVYVLAGWMARTAGSTRSRGWRAAFGWLFGLIGVGIVTAIGYLWLNARPPVPDAFYEPPGVLAGDPGALLRREPFTRAVPRGARAWRILYTTTRADNVPAVASAIVLAPAAGASEPRPVIAWTHGTTGQANGCAPSVLPAPFPFDATVPALEQLIAEKWVLVGTDYVGLGTGGSHPYLIGEPEGRSALDAVRAARHLPDLKIDARTVVWGHSQGGHAALWSGILAPRYAPDVEIAGVAALAPATEIGALVEAAQHTPVGKIMASYVVTAYSEVYPDVRFDEYVRPPVRARLMAARCLSGTGALLSVLTSLTLETAFFAIPPNSGRLGERLEDNVPRGHVIAPLMIAQGLADDLVLPSVQAHFVRQRCDSGQSLEFRTYKGRDHTGLVARDSPLTGDLVQWTRDRLAGVPVSPGCATVAR